MAPLPNPVPAPVAVDGVCEENGGMKPGNVVPLGPAPGEPVKGAPPKEEAGAVPGADGVDGVVGVVGEVVEGVVVVGPGVNGLGDVVSPKDEDAPEPDELPKGLLELEPLPVPDPVPLPKPLPVPEPLLLLLLPPPVGRSWA